MTDFSVIRRFRYLLGASLVMTILFFAVKASGDTSIMAGDMEITSRLMTFNNNIYVARGGLKAVQRESTLTADRGIYDRNLEIVKAIDNVKVTQPASELTSEYLEAYIKEDRILAKGNPRLERIVEREARDEFGDAVKKKTRVILTCKEVEGFNKENRFLAKGDVHLIEVPYREGETEEEATENEQDPSSDLTCETLELFTAEDKAIARTNVVIVTKTMRATGDKAIYLDQENRLIIVGHAHAYQTSKESPEAQEQVSELNANKIIYYPDEDRTIAVGDVHATVYPKGSSPADDSRDKKKKKKKKKEKIEEDPDDIDEGDRNDNADGRSGKDTDKTVQKKASKETSDDIDEYDYDNDAEITGNTPTKNQTTSSTPPPGLPEGNYTAIGGGSHDADQ